MTVSAPSGSVEIPPLPLDEAVAAGEERDVGLLVARTLAGLQRHADGPVRASMLKRAVLRKDPTFDEADHGFRGFGELLRHLESQHVVELGGVIRRMLLHRAPSYSAVVTQTPGGVMADNVAIVRGAYEALAKGDINTVLGAVDEQVEWHMAEHSPFWPGKAFVGPQTVLDGVFARLPQVYDGFRIDVQRIVALGDTVLGEVRYRGKGKVTGQDLDAQGAQVWDFRDGSACVGKSTMAAEPGCPP